MSIEAINEQLLRAVGVGIALFDGETSQMTFQNDVFSAWFEDVGEGALLPNVLPQVDMVAMRAALAERGRYASEFSFRKKRRTLVLSQIFTQTEIGNHPIIVLECQNITRIRELEAMLESYSSMVERNTREIQREKEQVEKLLLNVMPKAVYQEYKSFGAVAPQRFESVSVLSLDFVDFTALMEKLPPATFVSELNEISSAFDHIGQQFDCERLRTSADTYLCIAGMHESGLDHLRAVVDAASRFVHYLRRRNETSATPWMCRIGIGTGPVLGTLIGSERYVYDVFGAAVQDAFEARRVAQGYEALVAEHLAHQMLDLEFSAPAQQVARDRGFRALPAA